MSSDFVSPTRILVVEDEPADRAAIVECLATAGYDAAGYGSAIEGMRAALATRPHVVVLDLVLPDFSGIELARAFLATTVTRATCVIVVTASPQLVSFADPRSFGAAEVLIKPVLPEQLLAAVARCLDEPPATEELGRDSTEVDGELAS